MKNRSRKSDTGKKAGKKREVPWNLGK